MNKLIILLLLILFSCQEKKQKSIIETTKKVDTIYQGIPADSTTYPGHEAFNWTWESPKEKIILSDFFLKYIAKGKEPYDTFIGDLNLDKYLDLVLVSRDIDEDSLKYLNGDLTRELLVFLGAENNKYKFLFKNSTAIPCVNCCGMSDPFNGIEIGKGQLKINQFCGSSYKSVSESRFNYKAKFQNWQLDTVITESYYYNYLNYSLDTATKKTFGNKLLKTFVMYDD